MEYPAGLSLSLLFLLHPLSAIVFTTPHEIGDSRFTKQVGLKLFFTALLFYYEEQLLIFLDVVYSECRAEAITEYVQLCQPRIEELQLLNLQDFKGKVPPDVSVWCLVEML